MGLPTWDWVGLLITAILGSSVLSIVIKGWLERRKTAAEADNLEATKGKVQADTSSVLTGLWDTYAERLLKRIAAQDVRIDALEVARDSAEAQIANLLESRMERMNLVAKLTAENTSLRAEQALDKKRIALLEDEVASIQAALQDMSANLTKVCDERNRLLDRIGGLEEELGKVV